MPPDSRSGWESSVKDSGVSKTVEERDVHCSRQRKRDVRQQRVLEEREVCSSRRRERDRECV